MRKSAYDSTRKPSNQVYLENQPQLTWKVKPTLICAIDVIEPIDIHPFFQSGCDLGLDAGASACTPCTAGSYSGAAGAYLLVACCL